MPKVRADQRLFDLGLAESREKAKRLIMAGQVWRVEGGRKVPLAKPGQQLPDDAELALKAQERYVSRGAHKLLTALETFSIDVTGFICLDAGASTGGFTDCLLQAGAARVYAVDVGRAQLHEKLRQDGRVVNLEGVNLRHADDSLIPEPVDLVTADVSFISLTKVLPPCMRFLKPGGQVLALIKPQFELGPEANDKGVVRDEGLRLRAVEEVSAFCEAELGLSRAGVVPSKITGPKGNQEYVAWFRNV
ncbi:MAG: TlyA family RNA methyltransferase [Desulfovibrionaceae bacterium]